MSWLFLKNSKPSKTNTLLLSVGLKCSRTRLINWAKLTPKERRLL